MSLIRVIGGLAALLSTWGAQAQQPRVEEVVVVGSRVVTPSLPMASPVTRLTADDFAVQGVSAPSDVIRLLPTNAGSEFNVDPFTQNLSAGTSNFNLRGLGLNSTLVLLNGRRQTVSGGVADDGSVFVDLNALVPMIALQRVDVLKDGAAALYGTDAIAGVADFVTRTSFRGTEAQLDYANTANSAQRDITASGLVGLGHDRANVMVAASYLNRSWLPAPDRAYTAGKGFSSFGQPGAFTLLQRSPAFPDLPTGQPIIDPDCGGLAGGTPSPRASQPAGVTSGRVGTCTFDFASYYHLVPRERRWNTFLSADANLRDSVTVYAEAAYARSRVLRGTSPSFPLLNAPIIPADNPGNIFRVPALLTGRAFGVSRGGSLVPHESDTWRGVVGLKGEVAAWAWDVAATHSANDFLVQIENELVDRFTAALQGRGGPNNNQYFNPFGSAARSGPGMPTYNDPRVIADFTSLVTYDYRTRLSTLDATLNGEVFEVPAGPWGAAVGLQLRRDKVIGDLDDQFNRENYTFFIGGPDFRGARTTWATFAELRGPLSPHLSAQIALRHEDTSGDVGSIDPKLGLSWTPTEGLTMRATVGSSFRAPSTFQRFSVQMVQENIADPLSATTGFRAIRTVGAASLKPEQAWTSNIGLTWSPTANTEVMVDGWRFDYSDIIIKQGAQALVDANPNDVRIVRVGGQIVRIDTGYINASKALTQGLDISARHSWDGGASGQWTAKAEATWIDKYVIQDTPTSPRRDVVGNRNFRTFARSLPRWRANGTLGWTWADQSATAIVRFIDSYRDDQNTNRVIKSQTTLDLQYSVAFEVVGARSTLSFGALNVLDAPPPNVLTNAGYDSKVHDPRGRVVYVRLKAAAF